MNDFEFLLVLLAVFYFWECLFWIRRPGVAFRSWFGGGWNWKLPTGGLSNRFGGFLLSTPLPAIGGFFAVYWPPLIITETKLIKHPDPLDLYDEAPTESDGAIAFDQIKRVRAKRHHVLINEKKFVAAGSPLLAESLVERIKKLKEENQEKRPALDRQWLRESLDSSSIQVRLKSLRDSTRLLGFLATLLLSHMAIVVPWVGLNFTLSSTWPVLVGVLLFVNTAIAVQFCRLHRRFYPAASDERFQHTLMMSLFPLASIRAVETLARPLVENFHPLAVAKVLLNKDSFEQLASHHLRRLRVRVGFSSDDTERRYFEMLEAAMLEFLKSEKIGAGKLLPPPGAGDPSCHSFCPRCGSQFTFETGSCSDCGSVEVERFK